VVHCETCGIVDPEEEVKLPEMDFKLAKENNKLQPPLSAFETKCPKCNGKAHFDQDTLDTFVDSSWYYLRFLDHQNSESPIKNEEVKKWMPVDIYVGGMEHAIMHLLYARFIHKFICDEYNISDSPEDRRHPTHSNREPFKELIV
jgi:leucyl-tRNA synthetase